MRSVWVEELWNWSCREKRREEDLKGDLKEDTVRYDLEMLGLEEVDIERK